MMNERQFGLKIKERREDLGLSQQDLAIAMDLDQGKVSLIERGARKVDSVTELPKLAKVLQCSLNELLDDGETPIHDTTIGQLLQEYFPHFEFSDFEIQRINQFVQPVLNHYIQQDPEMNKKVANGGNK